MLTQLRYLATFFATTTVTGTVSLKYKRKYSKWECYLGRDGFANCRGFGTLWLSQKIHWAQFQKIIFWTIKRVYRKMSLLGRVKRGAPDSFQMCHVYSFQMCHVFNLAQHHLGYFYQEVVIQIKLSYILFNLLSLNFLHTHITFIIFLAKRKPIFQLLFWKHATFSF